MLERQRKEEVQVNVFKVTLVANMSFTLSIKLTSCPETCYVLIQRTLDQTQQLWINKKLLCSAHETLWLIISQVANVMLALQTLHQIC